MQIRPTLTYTISFASNIAPGNLATITSSGTVSMGGAEGVGQPPPVDVPEEVRVGSIIAYRAWNIIWQNTGTELVLRLKSTTQHWIWQPGQDALAECFLIIGTPVMNNPVHAVPSWSCTCGIYALKKEATFQGTVYGRVQLWGTVLEGTSGYRASHASILSIDGGLGLAPKVLEQVRDLYTPRWRTA